MKKEGVCLLLFLFFVSKAFSQKGLEWMPIWEKSILDSVMNLNYKHNEDFIQVSNPIILNFNIKVNRKFHLESKDGNFITLFIISQPFTCEDSTRYSNMTVNSCYEGKISWNRINKEHIFIAKEIVSEYYGKENADNWKDHVQYFSNIEANTKFNADTAFIISLPEKKYCSKYNHCKVLIIHKKDRGCLPMFFYYNDEGEKNLSEYIMAIERSFRYGDEPPAKNKLQNQDVIELISLPVQEKRNIIK